MNENDKIFEAGVGFGMILGAVITTIVIVIIYTVLRIYE